MGTFAVYADVPGFLANGNANVETASLVGGNATLTSAVVQGATTLPLSSTAGFPGSGTFAAYVLDGLNSEIVTASVSGGSLAVAAGTAAAHGAGVSVSSAGTAGCLADVIARASRAIENYCRQGTDGSTDRSLYAISRTEKSFGPSLRAAWDTDYALVIKPWRWPIQSVSAVTLQYGTDAAIGLNLANLALPADGKTMEIPYLTVLPAPTLVSVLGRRGQSFIATWTYVAGPCVTASLASVPDDLRMACYLLVADVLSQRQNPYGLSDFQQGKLRRTPRNRGDAWTSMFRERVYELLDQYAQQGWLAASGSKGSI